MSPVTPLMSEPTTLEEESMPKRPSEVMSEVAPEVAPEVVPEGALKVTSSAPEWNL